MFYEIPKAVTVLTLTFAPNQIPVEATSEGVFFGEIIVLKPEFRWPDHEERENVQSVAKDRIDIPASGSLNNSSQIWG